MLVPGNSGGGDGWEGGYVVAAVASLVGAVIGMVSALDPALISLGSSLGPNLAWSLSVWVAGVLVGYIFAPKTREESRRISIGEIAILAAAVPVHADGVIATILGDRTIRGVRSRFLCQRPDAFRLGAS